MATDPSDVADPEPTQDPASLADSAETREQADPEKRVKEQSDIEKLRHTGLEQFYGMRLTWSHWVIGWVSVLLVFQIVLTLAVGAGALDFKGHDLFLNLTVGQNFVQVVAMALIVVKFLHSRDKDDPPL